MPLRLEGPVGCGSNSLANQVGAAPLRHWFHDHMRAAIPTGSFAPGVRLLERNLMGSWGVSRTVVREVLKQLEVEGLVSFDKSRRGATVTDLSPREAAEISLINLSLLELAARLFMERADAAQRAKLLAEIGRVRGACRREGWSESNEIGGIYWLLLEGARCDDLSELVVRNQARIKLCSKCTIESAECPDEVIEALGVLEGAVRSNDAAQVQRALRLARLPYFEVHRARVAELTPVDALR